MELNPSLPVRKKGVRNHKTIIEACNLSFSYVNYEEEEIAALKDVSLNVKKGSFSRDRT